MRAGIVTYNSVIKQANNAVAYEDVYINQATTSIGNVVGEANTVAGSIAAMRAINDAKYVQSRADDGFYIVEIQNFGFDDLANHAGRNISAIAIGGRARARTTGTPIISAGYTGISVTPGSRTGVGTGAISDFLLATVTKSGGGTWTPTQANALLLSLSVTSDDDFARLYNLFGRFYYV